MIRPATNAREARCPPPSVEAQSAAGDARGGLPPRVVRQVPIERSGDRGPQLSVKSDQQHLVQHVPVDAHVIHKLGEHQRIAW